MIFERRRAAADAHTQKNKKKLTARAGAQDVALGAGRADARLALALLVGRQRRARGAAWNAALLARRRRDALVCLCCAGEDASSYDEVDSKTSSPSRQHRVGGAMARARIIRT